jgi:hypothetical protein
VPFKCNLHRYIEGAQLILELYGRRFEDKVGEGVLVAPKGGGFYCSTRLFSTSEKLSHKKQQTVEYLFERKIPPPWDLSMCGC